MTRKILAVVILGAIVGGCGEHSPTTIPPPGTASSLVVSLTTPHTDDGGIVVTVKGPGLGTFAAGSSSYTLYSRVISAGEARVIIIGDVAAGPLFNVTLQTPQELSRYSASIDQVVQRSDSLRTDLTGYAAGVTGH